MISFHDHMYYDARKALTQAARVDALACIAVARRLATAQLQRASAPHDVVLHAQSDLAETILARKAADFAKTEPYAALTSVRDREAAMDRHLVMELLRWLEHRHTGHSKLVIRAVTQDVAELIAPGPLQ